MKAAWMRTAAMSEISRLKNSAPTLQRAPRMKSILVGFVAVFALTGCGVGMDDVEGEDAATATASRDLASNSTGSQTELRGPIGGDPLVALPQDPIPVYTGSTIASGAGRPTK